METAKHAYLESSLAGLGPERRLALLCEGGVGFIAKARVALAEQDIETCHNHTIRAQNIYLELLIALDPEATSFSGYLQHLYYGLYEILLDANIRKDDARYAEAERIARGIQEMWDTAIAQARAEGASPGPPPAADPAVVSLEAPPPTPVSLNLQG